MDLYRAGNEARLAVNVGEAEGRPLLAFEETGAYRLLLPAMSEDAGELERFFAETIEPLAAHDVSATEGREKLGLGLKAMRVLGIASPRGPALEPGAEGGKVPRSSED